MRCTHPGRSALEKKPVNVLENRVRVTTPKITTKNATRGFITVITGLDLLRSTDENTKIEEMGQT
jgi:hypothetical protein